jgi:hypothetical protein
MTAMLLPRAPRPVRLVAGLAAALLLAGCAGAGAGRPGAPATPGQGVPTRVTVHVVTHDAKLIGTAVGGVLVTIRDPATGRVLAEGTHLGGTGDTKRLMQDARVRGEPLFTAADGARWQATIALTAPTMVEVSAEGPLGYPDQMARTTKRLVLLPGRHVEGDGLVLEMHGYVIDLLAPDTSTAVRGGTTIPVRARVRMLCSCPTQPGGMWQVEAIAARLVQEGDVVREVPLAYASEASTYAGSLPSVPPGRYVLEVVAASPKAATFGVVRRRITVRE